MAAFNILPEIERLQKDNMSYAKLNFGLTVAGLALAATMTAFFPPAGIAGYLATFGSIYAGFKGWEQMKNLGFEKSLQKAKEEAAEGATYAKTGKRAAKLERWANNVISATVGIFAVAAAVGLGAWLAPAAVTAAIVTPVMLVAGTAAVTGATTISFLRGAQKAARSVFVFEQKNNTDGQTPPPVIDGAPSAISSTRSIAPGFEVAANAPAQGEAPTVKRDAHALGRSLSA